MQLPPGVSQEDLLAQLWRVTPAATAAYLSREDREPWMPARHLEILSNYISAAVLGHGPRYNIISMPVRHGKSELTSKWTPVWYLDNWPHKRVMLCGHGNSFAAEWGGKVRDICSEHSDELRFMLADDSKAKNKWNTKEKGGMTTAGVGGPITGRGADLLLIDDPISNAEDANSLIMRDKVWEWWTSTASSRIEPGGCIFLIMARWHEDDLAGRLLSREWNGDGVDMWNEINMPAIYDAEAAKFGPDPLNRNLLASEKVQVGRMTYEVKGEALWPERWPMPELYAKKLLAATDADWLSLYQGRPARQGGKGNVYEGYDDIESVQRCDRDPKLSMFLGTDFNVDPLCWVIGQWREVRNKFTNLTGQRIITVDVLQEMAIPNSKTREACEIFIEKTKEYVNLARGVPIDLHIYGDASGHHTGTNADKTDFQIIREFFRRYPEFRVTYHLRTDNPPVRARVNAVNLALKTIEGYRRLFIDPACVELRKDMREVKWKRDSGGNTTGVIDKDDRKRTHLSDALGYVLFDKFGFQGSYGESGDLAR